MNLKQKAKKIATWIVVGGMLGIFLFDIATMLLGSALEKRYPITDEPFAGHSGATGPTAGGEASCPPQAQARIHFLDTGNSDCILLESDGHFALIDSGWGSGNPNPRARQPGCEQRVLAYLKRVAADENGVVTLDFILPTHYHYDHAGGFPLILADPAVRVNTVYLRELRTGNQKPYEVERWQIGEIRRRIEEAALARGFTLEADLPGQPFALGGMTLQFLNLDSYEDPRCNGENDNSVVTLVRFGQARALLMGDITASRGLEKKFAALGRVDLLKLGHHGYSMSTSVPFLREIRPKAAVATNGLGQVYPNVRWNLTLFARCPLFSGAHENGLIVSLFSDGELKLTGNLHL